MILYFSQYAGLFIYFVIFCVLAFVFFGISYIVAVQNGDTTKLSEKNVKILFLLSAVIFVVYVTNVVPIDIVECFFEKNNTEQISEILEPEDAEKLEKAAVDKKKEVVPWIDVALFYAVWIAALYHLVKRNYS